MLKVLTVLGVPTVLVLRVLMVPGVSFAQQPPARDGVILKDAKGATAPEAYAVAFSTDRSAWFFNSRRVAAVRPGRDGRFSIRNLPSGEYRLIAVVDLEQGEWFDPAVLERLLPAASPVTITGTEKKTQDLIVR